MPPSSRYPPGGPWGPRSSHSADGRASDDPFSRQSRIEGRLLSSIGVAVIVIMALGLISLLLWVLVELPHSIRQFVVGPAGPIIWMILAWAFIAGLPLIIASRSHFSRRAEDVLSNDRRDPVLFLRQFHDDGARGGEHRHETSEETIERALCSIGPVIAIGRPGDYLPPPGAARMYVPSESWQEKVSNYIDRAAMIALQTGETPGLRWEVSQVIARVEPSRVVLVVLDLVRYDRFQWKNGDLFPKSLPNPFHLPSDTRFIFFDDDWTPLPLTPTDAGLESFRRLLSKSNRGLSVQVIKLVAAFERDRTNRTLLATIASFAGRHT